MIKGLSYDIYWTILEAAKEEGSEPKDRDRFYLENDDDAINKKKYKLFAKMDIFFSIYLSQSAL